MKLIVIYFCLVLSFNSIQHEYELTRGRRLWAGMYNAVHYLDHITFLSEKMPGSHGIFSTYFDLAGGDNWSLTFTLEITGQLKRPGDGFVFGLSQEAPSQKDISEYKDAPQMLIKDKDGLKIKLASNQDQVEIRLEQTEPQICKLNPSDNKITFFIKSYKKNMIVSFHQSDSTQFKDCAIFQVEKNYLGNFYPNIYAKSSSTSALRFDVYSMTFATAIENLQITQFETRYDSYMPKLFKEISFLKKNDNFMKDLKKKYFDKENLNVKNLVKSENKALKSIEISKQYIGNCLNQQSSIKSYFDIQKESTQDFGTQIITGIKNWLDNSLNQMQEMDKYVIDLNQSIQKLDFKSMMKDTQDVISKIKTSIKDNQSDIEFVLSKSNKLFDSLKNIERRTGLNIEKIYKKVKMQQVKTLHQYQQYFMLLSQLYYYIYYGRQHI